MFSLAMSTTACAASIRSSRRRSPSSSTRCSAFGLLEPDGATKEVVRVETTQHEIGVGHGDLLASRVIADRAGSAPALWGRPGGDRPLSIQAIEPPPAPMVVRSIVGVATGSPNSISKLVECEILPSRMSPTSQEVPPMSSVTTLPMPASWPKYCPAMMPPASPESRNLIGSACPRRPGSCPRSTS